VLRYSFTKWCWTKQHQSSDTLFSTYWTLFVW